MQGTRGLKLLFIALVMSFCIESDIFLALFGLDVELVGLKMRNVVYMIAVLEPAANKCVHHCQSSFGTKRACNYVNLL